MQIRHALVVLTVVLGVGSARAQANAGAAPPTPKQENCQTTLNSLTKETTPASPTSCELLAAEVEIRFRHAAMDQQAKVKQALDKVAASPGAVQPVAPESTGTQGSVAQTEATPSTMPVALAGGAIAVAGTKAGPRLVAALALNPWAMTQGTSGASSLSQRLLDVSLNVPVNPFSGGGVSVDYVGVRLRVNALAGLTSERARKTVDTLITAVSNRAKKVSDVSQSIVNAMDKATDPSKCAVALIGSLTGNNAAEVADACNGAKIVTIDQLSIAEQDVKQAIEAARVAADPYFLGIDARADFGDPTLQGEAASFDNFSLLAAVAGGYRADLGRQRYFDIRGRAGFAYARTPANMGVTNVTSFDWSVGIGFGAVIGIRTLGLSVGAEGRHGSSSATEDPLAPSNYVNFRLGFNVPLSDSGSSLAIGITVPLNEPGLNGGPATVTVGGDMSLLSDLFATAPTMTSNASGAAPITK